MRYTATHVSVLDHSTAMMIHSDPLVLINEDGHAWTADDEDWQPIPESLMGGGCNECGRDDIVTTMADGTLLCSRHNEREFEVEVLMSFKIRGNEEDAHRHADSLLQAAWDSHHHAGMASQIPTEWHFELLEGAAADVTGDRD